MRATGSRNCYIFYFIITVLAALYNAESFSGLP